ncbi:MAG: hypothetical protein FWC61_02910 [Proteobacteria bacterium]|nr:hypothetical protein [Pseudomonadota bacterium]
MRNDEPIIAFTEKTGKILPQIFCRRFRHCCVLFPYNCPPSWGGLSPDRATGGGYLRKSSRKPPLARVNAGTPPHRGPRATGCVAWGGHEGGELYTLIQIGIDGVRLIPVGARELRRLQRAGWEMVNVKRKMENGKLMACNPHLPFTICHFPSFLSCVGFAKRAAGINNPFIWTPDQLYRKLKK